MNDYFLGGQPDLRSPTLQTLVRQENGPHRAEDNPTHGEQTVWT